MLSITFRRGITLNFSMRTCALHSQSFKKNICIKIIEYLYDIQIIAGTIK